MERVRFIEIEDEEPDLILSFALEDSDSRVRSLILLRTPKYEVLMPQEERGVHVSLEGDEDIKINCLESITIENDRVTISATQRTYNLSTEKIEKDQLNEMLQFIKKLNFDSCFLVRNA